MKLKTAHKDFDIQFRGGQAGGVEIPPFRVRAKSGDANDVAQQIHAWIRATLGEGIRVNVFPPGSDGYREGCVLHYPARVGEVREIGYFSCREVGSHAGRDRS